MLRSSDNCITYTSPSKTFNLAGMCASNIIIKNDKLRNKLLAEMMSNRRGWNLSLLGYKACELAYTKCDEWLIQLKDLIYKNHLFVKKFI